MDTNKNKDAAKSSTEELKALLEIDNTNRRSAWHHCLMNCLPRAVFKSGSPEILFNAAGFTYFNLELMETFPEKNSEITTYTIPELIDTFLIHEGVGIAIEARTPNRTVDLSYGDVLGFHLYRTFAEPETHPFKTDKPQAHMIREGTEFLIREVPEAILPKTTIHLLESIMQHLSVRAPKIQLVYLPETNQTELVFSIDDDSLSPEQKQDFIQKLGWFLPRYYIYSACDLNNISLVK